MQCTRLLKKQTDYSGKLSQRFLYLNFCTEYVYRTLQETGNWDLCGLTPECIVVLRVLYFLNSSYLQPVVER
jgi:hypothetical protein